MSSNIDYDSYDPQYKIERNKDRNKIVNTILIETKILLNLLRILPPSSPGMVLLVKKLVNSGLKHYRKANENLVV